MVTNLKFNKFLLASFFVFTVSNCSSTGMFRDSFDAAAQRGRNEIKKTEHAQYLMSSSGVAGILTGGLTGLLAGVTCQPAVIFLSLASNLGLNVAVTKTVREFALSDEDTRFQTSFVILQSELPNDHLKHAYVGNTQMIGNVAGLAVGAFLGVSIYSLISALFSKKASKLKSE